MGQGFRGLDFVSGGARALGRGRPRWGPAWPEHENVT